MAKQNMVATRDRHLDWCRRFVGRQAVQAPSIRHKKATSVEKVFERRSIIGAMGVTRACLREASIPCGRLLRRVSYLEVTQAQPYIKASYGKALSLPANVERCRPPPKSRKK
jgi:hypothetical protein